MSKAPKKKALNLNTADTKKPTSRLLINLLLASSLVILSIVINYQFPRPSAFLLNGGISGAFKSKTTNDPMQSVTPDEIVIMNKDTLEFETNTTTAPQITMSFLFQCEPQCHNLWVGHKNINGEYNLKLLGYHPLLNNLAWFKIRDGDFYIYQKEVLVHSYKELLTNPELADQILTDHLFASLHPEYPFTMFLEETEILPEKSKYIITNYTNQGQLDDWYRFAANFNTKAIDTSSGNIRWAITHQSPDNSQTQIKIARIHIH